MTAHVPAAAAAAAEAAAAAAPAPAGAPSATRLAPVPPPPAASSCVSACADNTVTKYAPPATQQVQTRFMHISAHVMSTRIQTTLLKTHTSYRRRTQNATRNPCTLPQALRCPRAHLHARLACRARRRVPLLGLHLRRARTHEGTTRLVLPETRARSRDHGRPEINTLSPVRALK